MRAKTVINDLIFKVMQKFDLKDVLTFDCETTWLPPNGAKWDVDFAEFPNIVQLAWAVNEKERSYIIKPEGWEIPEASTEVHGITAERANAEGVPFADIIDEFLEDCEKARLLVGHNIYFDTSIVKAMILRIMGREYYDAKAEDALFKGKRIDTMMKTINLLAHCMQTDVRANIRNWRNFTTSVSPAKHSRRMMRWRT